MPLHVGFDLNNFSLVKLEKINSIMSQDIKTILYVSMKHNNIHQATEKVVSKGSSKELTNNDHKGAK